ncbi:VCBS domain-containing protein, partial [Vibrio diazotrophicus]|uniref:VCBS domain-containing protein n=1 Tax=Vibrio diazotrophicus TaxID=685 RepID=UPI00142E5B75
VSVSDGDASDTESVTITITGTNDAPIIDVDNEGYADTGSITEDGVLVDGVVSTTTLSGSVSASDEDDTSLSWTSTGTASVSDEDAATLAANNVSTADLGTFTLDANGNWTFELTPEKAQFLNDGDSLTLTYPVSVSDGDASDSKPVTITITGTNDAPIAVVDSETVNEGSTVVVTESVLTNDTDAENDSLSVVGLANGSNGEGSVTANADGSFTIVTALGGTVVMQSNGTYTYTASVLPHISLDTIEDSFTYLASDGVDSSSWTTVTIDVVDTDITAKDDFAEIAEESNSVSGNVITNDLQDDTDLAVTVTSVTYGAETYLIPATGALTINAATGILEINSKGSYTFTAIESSPAAVVTDVTKNTNISVYASTNESISPSGAEVENNGNSGLGVSSHCDQGNQIDGNESLVFKLDNAASVVSATLKSNGNGNDDEIEIAAYDTAGKNISEQVSISIVNHVVTVTSTNGDIGYVVFGLSSAANSNDKYYVDETISITYSNNDTSPSEVFSYTVKDGDGDISSANLTINGIDSVNDAPEIALSEGSGSLVVSEEGLNNGNQDNEGSSDKTDSYQASGSFTIGDEESDANDLTVELVSPTETLYSNGVEIEWATVNGVLVGTAGDNVVLKVELSKDSSNSYSYLVTLLGALDHSTTDLEDTLTFDFNVSVSDSVNTTIETISVTVEDDSPESSASVIINPVATDSSESHTVLGTYAFTRSSTTGCNTENEYKFISNNSDKSITVTAVGLNGTTHEELTFSDGGIGVSSYKQGGWNTGFDDRFNSEVDYKYVNGE